MAQKIADPAVVTDTNHRIIFINEPAQQLYGYSADEVFGKHSFILSDDPLKEKFMKEIQHAIARGRTWTRIIFNRKKDGSTFINECRISPIRDEEDKIKGQIGIHHPISDFKQLEELHKQLLRGYWRRKPTLIQRRFNRDGFQGLTDQELIELLLSLALPARLSSQLAEKCIARYKNLRDFMAAPPEEIVQMGITPACVLSIKLLHDLPIRILQQKIVSQPVFKSSRAIFDYLYYAMRDLKKEVFKVIYLDNSNHIVEIGDLFKGSRDNIPIRPREIVEEAIKHQAGGLIFVHNHPSGDPSPSEADKQLTRDLVFIGCISNIKVLDHIIIGANGYYSFSDEKLIQKYQDAFLNLRIKSS